MAKPVAAVQKTVRKRPAETASGTLSIVVGALVALFGLNLSAGQIGAVVALVGLVPAGVTWFRGRFTLTL